MMQGGLSYSEMLKMNTLEQLLRSKPAAEQTDYFNELVNTLAEQVNERERRTERSRRAQIIVSILAIFVALYAVFQDRSSNAASAQQHTEMLAVVEQGNQRYAIVERENQVLREQVKALGARIVALETAQRAAVKAAPPKQKHD